RPLGHLSAGPRWPSLLGRSGSARTIAIEAPAARPITGPPRDNGAPAVKVRMRLGIGANRQRGSLSGPRLAWLRLAQPLAPPAHRHAGKSALSSRPSATGRPQRSTAISRARIASAPIRPLAASAPPRTLRPEATVVAALQSRLSRGRRSVGASAAAPARNRTEKLRHAVHPAPPWHLAYWHGGDPDHHRRYQVARRQHAGDDQPRRHLERHQRYQPRTDQGVHRHALLRPGARPGAWPAAGLAGFRGAGRARNPARRGGSLAAQPAIRAAGSILERSRLDGSNWKRS